MIEIVPELHCHCSSPMLALLCKNLDYKPQSINQPCINNKCIDIGIWVIF